MFARCSSLAEASLVCPVDGYEEVELAFFGSDLRDVDVEIADRVVREAVLLRLVTLHLGKAADTMPFEAAVQAGSRQMRDRRLQAVQAIVERQQRMPPEGNHDGLLVGCEDGRVRLLRSHWRIRC